MNNFRKKVIVDLDGTICDVTHRLKYTQGPLKDSITFHSLCSSDKPIKNIINLVEDLYSLNYEIIFYSCRYDTYLPETINWINTNLNIPGYQYQLLLRSPLDKRADEEIKFDLLKTANIEISNIYLILEDRTSVVDFWRSKGVTCLQVAPGNF